MYFYVFGVRSVVDRRRPPPYNRRLAKYERLMKGDMMAADMTVALKGLENSPEFQAICKGLLGSCEGLADLLARMAETAINSVMSAQADELCGAAYGERSDERQNYRNGYRHRKLDTTVGTLDLSIPKLRFGHYSAQDVIRPWRRADDALVAAVMEMYVNGVSTRKVERIVKEMGVEGMSKSQVSRLCQELDAEVAHLREDSLALGLFRVLWLDATYCDVRVNGRFVSTGVVTAIALDPDGHKRCIGIDEVDTESHESWLGFLQGLKGRGLDGVVLVVSDDHQGLVRAIAETFQGASWQRCVAHFAKNVAAAAPSELLREEVRQVLKLIWGQRTALDARACYHAAIDALEAGGCAKAARLMEDAEQDALRYLDFDPSFWPWIRSNNVQERSNREIKRRTDVVQCFPSKESLIRLVGAQMVEENLMWQSKRVVAEKRLPLLDEAYSEEVTPEMALEAAERARRAVEGAIAEAKSNFERKGRKLAK